MRLEGDFLTIGVAIDRKRSGNFLHNWRLTHVVRLEEAGRLFDCLHIDDGTL